MRRQGKSWAAEQAKEAALNRGLKVIVCTQETITLQKRKKHLTLIQVIPKRIPPTLVIYDEFNNFYLS